MSFDGPEPILDQLKTSLTARMPARCAALAAVVPAVSLPTPATIEIGDRDFFSVSPAIALTVRAPATVEHEHLGRMNVGWPIELRVYLNDETPETLERRMLRYLRAVREALVDAETAGEFTFTWSLNGNPIEPSPQRRGTDDRIERDVAVLMTCWTAEER